MTANGGRKRLEVRADQVEKLLRKNLPKSWYAETTFVRWLKFNFVGGLGIGVQFAALLLVKEVLHFHYLAATAIAVEAAVVHNFVWHEHFTWVDRTRSERGVKWRQVLSRLVRFQLANGAVSLLGSLALMKLLVGLGHIDYRLANLIAIALCSVANFVVSNDWVFAMEKF